MDPKPPTLPFGFAALDGPLGEYDQARVAIVPLPYDGTTSYRPGTRDGPAAVLAASQQVDLFDEELEIEPAEVGIATLDPLEADARGPEQMTQAVEAYCRQAIQDGKFVIGLGGEHSVSLGCLRAQLAACADPLTVLQIDAHADLRQTYQGSPYSHACTMRRALELCPVVGVGLRSYSREEHDLMREHSLAPFTMKVIRDNPDWISAVVDRLGPKVYLTVDLDGLDPSICPGVGTPEPGGLDWLELLTLLRTVFDERQVVGADVVECMPLSGHHVTEYLAARLILKMIAYRFRGNLSSGA